MYQHLKNLSVESNNKSSVNSHLARDSHTSVEKPFECKLGSTKYNQITRLADLHPEKWEKLYKCNICNKKFRTINVLLHHTKTHLIKYKCHHCIKTFVNYRELAIHLPLHPKYMQLYEHRKVKIYACKICSREFLNNYQLTKHQNQVHVHLSKKPPPDVRCKICNMNTLKTGDPEQHKCDEMFGENECFMCQKKFVSNQQFKRHWLLHSNYRCEICMIKFITREQSITHLQIHINQGLKSDASETTQNVNIDKDSIKLELPHEEMDIKTEEFSKEDV